MIFYCCCSSPSFSVLNKQLWVFLLCPVSFFCYNLLSSIDDRILFSADVCLGFLLLKYSYYFRFCLLIGFVSLWFNRHVLSSHTSSSCLLPPLNFISRLFIPAEDLPLRWQWITLIVLSESSQTTDDFSISADIGADSVQSVLTVFEEK